MATPPLQPWEKVPSQRPSTGRAKQFWQRVTEGMELNQLWSQFRKDAHSSYRLYSQDVDPSRMEGAPHSHHFFGVAKQFFWAIVEKLTPARRVLLLLALVLIIVPGGEWTLITKSHEVKVFALDFHFWGGLLMFVLLVLEVADRVVMKRDLQIAKEIQAWLLPSQPPSVRGLEIAFATRPANTVAGDYYDVFARASTEPGSNTFLIAVADVAGKSIPAAMLMATFQASLKTLSSTHGPLTELVAYEPLSRRLIYVNAGHNNPILRRRTGSIERLEAGGVPLGVVEDATYESAESILQPGDWLAIFTDGVIEAENTQQQEYGEARFIGMLHSGVMTTPDVLLESILTDLDRFAGNAPQHDDETCVLMRAV
jgi:phosphoserine phosphatase RsbU/P